VEITLYDESVGLKSRVKEIETEHKFGKCWFFSRQTFGKMVLEKYIMPVAAGCTLVFIGWLLFVYKTH
jgi:hypothetical protein